MIIHIWPNYDKSFAPPLVYTRWMPPSCGQRTCTQNTFCWTCSRTHRGISGETLSWCRGTCQRTVFWRWLWLCGSKEVFFAEVRRWMAVNQYIKVTSLQHWLHTQCSWFCPNASSHYHTWDMPSHFSRFGYGDITHNTLRWRIEHEIPTVSHLN